MIKQYFSILDRYIAKEVFFTWLAVSVVLVLILISTTLANLLGKAANGLIPSDVVLPLLAMTGLDYFISTGPLAMYLGVLLSFSRFYKDNEVSAMNACGISLMRLYRSLMLVVVPITIMVALLTLFAHPWSVQLADQYKARVESRSELSGLVAGQFNKTDKAIMFMKQRSEDGDKMQGIFLQQNKVPADVVETADELQKYRDAQGRDFLVFINGQYYNGKAGDLDYTIVNYKKHGIFVPQEKDVKQRVSSESIHTFELWNSKNPWHYAELQWRFTLPTVTFLLAILALPLSYTTPRKGRYSKLAIAIFIYLLYSNLVGVAQNWLEHSKVPQWMGMWWIHIFVILLIMILLVKRHGGFKSVWKRQFGTPI